MIDSPSTHVRERTPAGTLDYAAFLSDKMARVDFHGFDVPASRIHSRLYPFQRDVVLWALRLGRAALFEECGLGKTMQQLEWARHVADHTGLRVLVLAPLAVAHQTVSEGGKIDLAVTYCRSQAEADASAARVIVANYDMLDAFDPAAFGGVVLDESSILKAFSGRTKKKLVAAFSETPYRLCATATPAPNDHIEIGNHSEFLGIMPSSEMLARWFLNDTMNAGTFRLKGHARADFWRWVTSWAVCIGKPSDLGDYDDGGFILPPLDLRQHLVRTDYARAQESGRLFFDGNPTATELWRDKKATTDARAAIVAEIVAGVPADEAVIIWCDTNKEADAIRALIPEAVEVRGDQSVAVKEERLRGFTDGDYRVIVTKPDIAGFGLNWQHCGVQVFCGVTYSFEKLYQSLRRSLRYGRVGRVVAHIVYAESEGNVIETIARKQELFMDMRREMVEAVGTHGLDRDGARLALVDAERDYASGEDWQLHLGDSCTVLGELPADSVHLSVFSPPFAQLYTYTDSLADLGNCADEAEFFRHFRYFVPELLRVTVPGRLAVVHCKDLPQYIARDGAAGLLDFPGHIIREFEAAGWQYHSRIVIWKDPVTEVNRTNSYGLLHKSFAERAEVCRVGMPDVLVVFRKWAEGMTVGQVKHNRVPGDYIGTDAPVGYRNDREYSIQVWQRYASPVWWDINQTNVLNGKVARDDQDEKHICPLQLDVIARAIDLWSMPGETVLDPFSGVGSTGHEAVRMGRKYVGIELKRRYWEIAQKFLADAAISRSQKTLPLFDDMPDVSVAV